MYVRLFCFFCSWVDSLKFSPKHCVLAEVGRVPKNCTQVKVLIEIFTQVKVKVIV